MKGTILQGQMGFTPEIRGWFVTGNSNNVIYPMNQMKEKNHMIISVNTDSATDSVL